MRIKPLVEEALKNDPQSRNSDIRLTNYIWINHYGCRLFMDKDGDWAIKLKEQYNVPTIDDVKRIRAKIQNEEHKFLPTDIRIVKQRKINEELWRDQLGYNPELRTV